MGAHTGWPTLSVQLRNATTTTITIMIVSEIWNLLENIHLVFSHHLFGTHCRLIWGICLLFFTSSPNSKLFFSSRLFYATLVLIVAFLVFSVTVCCTVFVEQRWLNHKVCEHVYVCLYVRACVRAWYFDWVLLLTCCVVMESTVSSFVMEKCHSAKQKLYIIIIIVALFSFYRWMLCGNWSVPLTRTLAPWLKSGTPSLLNTLWRNLVIHKVICTVNSWNLNTFQPLPWMMITKVMNQMRISLFICLRFHSI